MKNISLHLIEKWYNQKIVINCLQKKEENLKKEEEYTKKTYYIFLNK